MSRRSASSRAAWAPTWSTRSPGWSSAASCASGGSWRARCASDADARPIRKGKLRAPTEFGYVFQFAEITENTRRGARGLLLPAPTTLGNPTEDTLLAATADELARLALAPRDVALDGAFSPGPTASSLPDAHRVFIAGRQSTGSGQSDRGLAKSRGGWEGRISHLKRRYGTRRSRLKGEDGARTTVGWTVLAYNLDTL